MEGLFDCSLTYSFEAWSLGIHLSPRVTIRAQPWPAGTPGDPDSGPCALSKYAHPLNRLSGP